jgi:hypothetical protein
VVVVVMVMTMVMMMEAMMLVMLMEALVVAMMVVMARHDYDTPVMTRVMRISAVLGRIMRISWIGGWGMRRIRGIRRGWRVSSRWRRVAIRIARIVRHCRDLSKGVVDFDSNKELYWICPGFARYEPR